MKKFNFLSKSSSQSCGHNVVTLASTVGSQEEFYVSGGNSRGAFTPADVCQTSSVRLNRFTALRRGTMLKLLSVLVLVLTIGVGQMWGAVTSPITLSTNSSTVGSTTGTLTNKFDYKLTFSNASQITANYVQNAKSATIYNTVAIPGSITSIKLTDCATTAAKTDGSFTIYAGTSSGDGCTTPMGTITGLSNTAADKTVNFTGDYTYFKIVNGGDRVLKISSIVIYFSSGSVAVSSVVVSPTSKAILPGETFTITPTVSPSNATNKNVTWSSNATSKATVSNGTVTGVSAGSATITATSAADNTKSASCDVTVYGVTMQARDEEGNEIPSGGPGAPSRTGTSISPAADANNYVFKEWQIDGATLGNSKTTKSNTITSPTKAVTVTAVYYKPITITYKANGETFTTQTYGHGGTLAFPASDPDGKDYSCTGKTFVGWVAEANKDYSHASNAPTYATAGGSVTTSATYYAVFATASGSGSAQYVKVTSTADITDGDYLIVNETNGVAFNGAINSSSFDVTSNKIDVTINSNSNTISANSTVNAAKFVIGTDANSNRTIKSASGYYIGRTSNSTGINASSTTAYTNSFSFDASGNVTITASNDYILRYNDASGQDRFRYYSGTSVKAIQLYKYNPGVTYSGYQTSCCPAHTVTLVDANGSTTGGTYDATPKSACEGTSVTLSKNVFTGYTFGIWTVMNGETPVSVNEDAFTMPDANVTVQASFTAKHHNVVFHKNDGGEDETNNQDYTYGVAQNLKTIATIGWTRSGYNFGGWMTSASGEAADYADGASYTLSVDNTVDLYALWVADNTRTIAYSGDEHINYSSKPTSVAQDAANFTASFSLATGYELKGVTATMGGAAIAAEKIAFTQSSLTITAPTGGFTDNIAVTFNVAEIKYTVTFHAGTGTCGTESLTQASYGAAIELPSATIGAQGWSFVGWAEASVASATSVEPTLYTESFTPAADDDLYAVYRKTITEGGTSQIKMSYGSVEGWTLSEGVSGSSYYFLEKDEYIESPEIADMSAISSIKVTVGAYNSKGAYKIEAGGSQIITDTKPSSSSVDRTYNANEDFSALSGAGKIRLTNTDGVVQSNSQPSGTRMHAMTINIDVAAVYSYHSTPASATGLAVQVAPTKTVYKVGDTFDPAGTTLRVTYSNSTTEDITSGFTYSPTTALTKENTSVTFSYLGLNCNQTISVLDPVATPTFSPASGSEVSVSETITISCETASATIYYTTDGSDPTNTSAVYSTPIAPYSTIKAIAMKADMAPSEIATATYTVVKNSQTLTFTQPSYSFRLNSDEYNAFKHQAVSGAVTTVTYSSSNTAVADIEGGVVVLKGGKGTATITATAAETATYSEASATYTITVLREGATRIGDFKLVTNANQLEDGDYILLTSSTQTGYNENPDYAYVFSGITSSAGTSQSKNVINDEITYAQLLSEGNTAKIIYLEKVGDYWAFNYGTDDDIYIAAGTSTGSSAAALRGLDKIDNYCKWDISIGEGNVANVNNQGNATYYALSFNGTAIKSYKQLQGNSLRIYKQKDKNKLPQTLSFATPSYEFPLNESAYTSFAHQAVSGAQTAVTYTTSNAEVAAINNNTVVLNGGVGTATITATAAESEDYEHASATYTITVIPGLSTVTFNVNGATTSETETESLGGVTVPENPSAVGDYTFAGWSKSQRAVESADDPALVTITAGKYYPTSSETLYAVYTMDKEDEVAGMYLTTTVEETEKTIGYLDGNSLKATDANHSALALWYMDDYLFYMNGTTKMYLYNDGTDAKIYSVSENAKPGDLAKATDNKWTKITNNDGTITLKRSDARILAWHTSNNYFRGYNESTTSYNKFTVSTATESITEEVPYYTTAPSADVTPTISFAEASKTIAVVDENGALNTCTNALTTNSTGAVTYVSSDESIAEVASNGTVSVKAVGEVTITANVAAVAGTWKAINKSYTLTIEKATASASFGTPATTIVYKDNTIALPATSAQAITITYSCSNTNYATVDASGNVTGVATNWNANNQRQVTIYAEWAETDYYEASTNSTRASQTVFVKNNAKTQTLSFTDEAKDFGSDQGDKVYTNTLNGAKTSVTYASNNETVAEVDENTGEVTVHTNAAGSATITATAAAGNVIEDGIQYAYAQAQEEYVISIVYPRPTISVASCEFKAPFEVELSSEATNLEMIVYTTDGTDPSFAGNYGDIYTEPITINATTTLKAIAVSNEDEESPVATATYTKLVPEFTEWSFEDGESVAMNVEQTITASEGAVITYIISKGGVEVASATTESNVATFTLTEAGNYEVDAEAQWNVANGFVSESVSRTIHVKGAVHLPISYTGNGTGVSSEPYFTVEGNYVVDDYNANSYVNAPIKIRNTGSLTAAFLDEPSNVVFYLGGNGVNGSTLKVQESADGENFEDVEVYTADDIPASVVNFETGYNGGGVKQNLNLKSTTRFVRWSYTKVSGNVALGKIAIYPKSMEPDNSYEVPVDFTGDVVVEDGVAWNITETQTIHDLTVKQGAEVWNNEAITVNNLYIEAQEGKSGQITENESITINGNAYYDLTLNTSGTMDNSLWYAFAVPFQVDAATGIQRLSNDGVASPAQFNGHYVLLKYNSAAYASAGEGWEYMNAGETLMPGKFYMIALNSNAYNRVRMTKKAGAALNNKADLTLSLVGEGVHANWNALANNALAYVQVNAAGGNSGLKVQTYNSADNNYTAFDFNKVTLTVGTPFFIQAAVNNDPLIVSVATSTENTTVKAPQREAQATEEFQIRLGENTESYYDILYVSASEEALNEYQIGHDLAKAGVSKTVPQMYVPAYGAKLCDAEFPLENNEATFPLTFTAPNAGTYQIYVAEAAQDAELYLLQNNSIVWNLTLSPYEIALPQGTTEGYSLLLKAKAPNTATGVDEVQSDNVQCTKVVIDDHVYILRGGKMYGVDGKEVR